MSLQNRDSAVDELAALNSAAMGTEMPVITLPNGERVQTGTVGALIINITHYDELLGRASIDQERKTELEKMMAASLPVLKKANMFSLFKPHEWIQGTSVGRQYVGKLALRNGVA